MRSATGARMLIDNLSPDKMVDMMCERPSELMAVVTELCASHLNRASGSTYPGW
jgi:hypothetical protein